MRILSRRSRTAGFTLLELVVAIVLLGILASVTVFSFDGSRSRGQLLVAAMQEYANALTRMKADTACFPARLSALALRSEAESSLCQVSLVQQWNGPYVRDARTNANGQILLDQIAPQVVLDLQTGTGLNGGTAYLVLASHVPVDVLSQALMACNGAPAGSETAGARCSRTLAGDGAGSLALRFAEVQ
jgi:prepilin-type N-terminal cleavage/methylation domain-containing protein